MKFRMYVDEVGNPDLNSSDNPLHRFLSLTGIIINLDHVRETIHPEMEKLKSKFFNPHPDDPIIFHRKDMMNGKFPFEILRDKEIRKKFDNKLIDCLKNWQYTVITVCLDKKIHKETYTVWHYDPYHYCLALLLERFTIFLEQIKCKGDVMAESRGGKEDKRLKASFLKLWNEGTDYISNERFQYVLTSKKLKVKPKTNNISGLQLADLVAHPSRNEILYENGLLEGNIAPFAEKIINLLQGKYYQHGIRIHGKKFI
ncbi:MAG: DUF3800 domain-containing protein [Candidatus Marinimicrobia bacterium]|nr:DUF3800 domain-containing protein [Candidatus Neomarinimicrobiota bacterium]